VEGKGGERKRYGKRVMCSEGRGRERGREDVKVK
jgi:hypothetical protein